MQKTADKLTKYKINTFYYSELKRASEAVVIIAQASFIEVHHSSVTILQKSDTGYQLSLYNQ